MVKLKWNTIINILGECAVVKGTANLNVMVLILLKPGRLTSVNLGDQLVG